MAKAQGPRYQLVYRRGTMRYIYASRNRICDLSGYATDMDARRESWVVHDSRKDIDMTPEQFWAAVRAAEERAVVS